MSDGNMHALLSPSSAERWMVCPASMFMEQGIADSESDYAKEGTAAHALSAMALNDDRAVWEYTVLPEELSSDALDYVQEYVNNIRDLSTGHRLLVEQQLPIGHITLEPDAFGTGDAIIIHEDGATIEINDLKFGMGVKVYAERNKQMMLYALGALHQFSMFGDFRKVVMRIHQPRLNHWDEWNCDVAELEKFADEVTTVAKHIWQLAKGDEILDPEKDFHPSEAACRWCKAKATCPALIKHTLTTVADDFVAYERNPVVKLNSAMDKLQQADNRQLAWYMQNLGLIEDWIAAVRQKVEVELFAGRDVPGFKLVEGKRGNRQWLDETEVEEKLKALRVAEETLYKRKLLSPADAEKLFRKKPEQWAALKENIVQNKGKPSVAPVTDPRPALALGASADDFELITSDTE